MADKSRKAFRREVVAARRRRQMIRSWGLIAAAVLVLDDFIV
jgi:hypothetical protein